MPATLAITQTATANGINVGSTVNETGGILQQIAGEALGGTASNTQFDLAFKFATLKGFSLLSSVDCTIKTNSTSSPGNVIELVGGTALIWGESTGFANPFSADVTKLYITNDDAADTAGVINALFLNDITP